MDSIKLMKSLLPTSECENNEFVAFCYAQIRFINNSFFVVVVFVTNLSQAT